MARNGFNGSRKMSTLFQASVVICRGVDGFDPAVAWAHYNATTADEDLPVVDPLPDDFVFPEEARPVVAKKKRVGRRKKPLVSGETKKELRRVSCTYRAAEEDAFLEEEFRDMLEAARRDGDDSRFDEAQDAQFIYRD